MLRQSRLRMERLRFISPVKGSNDLSRYYDFIMSFDEKYFSSHTYANITFAKYSMYWWSNRFFAMLARRYGKRGARLLEVGSGMGHLVAQLEDTFETVGIDLNHWAVEQSKSVVNQSALQTASAQELPFTNNSFNVVIIKHIGYQDPTHISLKQLQEWLSIIENAGFELKRVFSDGFWVVPYIRFVPKQIQKLFFGSLGGIQAITGIVFLPMTWGESILVIAKKK